MSNPLAIQAATDTLRGLLLKDDFIDEVSVRPPDRLLDSDATGSLNLYLYRVAPNTSWRNSPLPDRTRPSEQGFPPLALDLYYLLTAYGDDSDNSREQELLGRAMHILHSNASVSPDFVKDATQRLVRGNYISDLHEQIERIRITPDPLSVDDLSKLWNTFQTQYRISTAYCVSVVLIDGAKPARSPLPVLRRGEDDQGVKVFVGLDPRLERVVYRRDGPYSLSQLGASIDGRTTLFGNNLPAQGLRVTIRDPRVASDRVRSADIVASFAPLPNERTNEVELRLNRNLADWQAGVYTVEVSYERDNSIRISNRLPFAIVPEIRRRSDGRPIILLFREDDKDKMQVEIVNGVHERRRAFLILNGRGGLFQIPRDKQSEDDTPEAPVFDIDEVPPGDYRLRIRIDGVDSLLTKVEDGQDKPFLEFDPNMTITL